MPDGSPADRDALAATARGRHEGPDAPDGEARTTGEPHGPATAQPPAVESSNGVAGAVEPAVVGVDDGEHTVDARPPATPGRRRTRRVLWAAIAVAVPTMLLVGVLASRPPAATRAADSPLVGKPAPQLERDTLDGEHFRLADRRGRWVLVNFFATWCVPCRLEHPELVRFDERHRQLGDAEVMSVIYDDSPKAVREFRDREGGSWPMVVDPKGRIALDFGVAGVPESYLIDPRGLVAAKVVGGVRADELDRLLARAKQTPEPREESQ